MPEANEGAGRRQARAVREFHGRIWHGPALTATVFVVAAFNAAIGPTGGVSFAVTANLPPPRAALPLHGAVEAVSAAMRAIALRRFIDWRHAGRFAVVGLCGLPLGLWAVSSLPQGPMPVAIGLFVLASVWWPGRAVPVRLPAAAGALTTALTLAFGAAGPLVAAIMVRRFPDCHALIGSHAAVMPFQHGLKVPAPGLLGVDSAARAGLLLALLAAASLCTVLGRIWLGRWPEACPRQIFRLLMTLLGMGPTWQGFAAA